MSGTIPIIAQPSNLPMDFSRNASLNSNTNLLPLEGSSLLFDSTFNGEQQAESILRQMGREIPDKVYSQVAEIPKRSPIYDELLSQIDTPEGLQKFKEYQKTDNEKIISELKTRKKAASREFARNADQYEVAIKPIRAKIKKDDMDGRSHISAIYDTIENINSNYQKSFGEITKNATKYMESLNSALGKMSKNLESAPDGKIKLFKNRVFDDLNESMKMYYKASKYQSIKSGDNDTFEVGYTKILDKIYTGDAQNPNINKDKLVEYMEPISSFDHSESALSFWEKKLGGQGFIVVKANNKINIYPDMNSVKIIYNSVRAVTGQQYGEVEILTQVFQSLQTGIDSQKNAVNNSISRLLETFRQDNGHFETLTQLLIQLLKDLFQYNAGFANT
ncbi:hypothetical protein AHYW_000186 [Providencia manganoxydans]|uniref:hypothetical protein n=1 Tax=Providencia manganoxydans TaxID=2923283 RepID=UPI003B9985F5